VTPAVGDLVTVLPHKMPGVGLCGRWHGRVRSRCRISTDQLWVQEVKPAGHVWEMGMTAQARIDRLVPIELDVDLFGNPAGSMVGGAR
jgi:hypothetical protein